MRTMKLCVEAAIGLGKSTLLKNLKKMSECDEMEKLEVVAEPVKFWRNVCGQDLLKLFAENPEKFSFQAQVHILSTMSSQREKKFEEKIVIFERSINASEFIFKQVLVEKGYLTSLESKILSDLYFSLSSRAPKLDAIIYLKGSAEIALKRIKSRNFECDEDLPLDYLQKIQEKHDEYIEKIKASGIEVLTIDAEKDEQTVATEAKEFIIRKYKELSQH